MSPGTFATHWYADHSFVSSYFATCPGHYATGETGLIDGNGYVLVMSRADDGIGDALVKAPSFAKNAARLRLKLAAIDTARFADDMNIPGCRLHPLERRAKNRWSILVSGNWRLNFEFRDGNAYILGNEDYH